VVITRRVDEGRKKQGKGTARIRDIRLREEGGGEGREGRTSAYRLTFPSILILPEGKGKGKVEGGGRGERTFVRSSILIFRDSRTHLVTGRKGKKIGGGGGTDRPHGLFRPSLCRRKRGKGAERKRRGETHGLLPDSPATLFLRRLQAGERRGGRKKYAARGGGGKDATSARLSVLFLLPEKEGRKMTKKRGASTNAFLFKKKGRGNLQLLTCSAREKKKKKGEIPRIHRLVSILQERKRREKEKEEERGRGIV